MDRQTLYDHIKSKYGVSPEYPWKRYPANAVFPDDPELDYQNLEGIHKGTEASAAFMTLADHSPKEITQIRAQLLKYCCLDTLAMVKVLNR